MSMNVRDDLAKNTDYLLGISGLAQLAAAKAGGISQRSVSNAQNKESRDLQLSTIAGLAKAFKVLPWVMLLPHDELKQYVEKGALSIIQNYFASSSDSRKIIAAVAESHAKPHHNNPPDDPLEK